MWGLWLERNTRLFEDVELPVVDLCRNVLNMLYVWVSAHSPSRIMFAEFLHSCSFVSSDYVLLYTSCVFVLRPLRFLLNFITYQ
jgi:hypothetical protein